MNRDWKNPFLNRTLTALMNIGSLAHSSTAMHRTHKAMLKNNRFLVQ